MKHVSKMPDWVKQQSGLRPGQKGYGPKLSLIHRYAKELNARGARVTHEWEAGTSAVGLLCSAPDPHLIPT